MKKVLVVFGTRPEAIKLAPVIFALRREASFIDCRVCVTAQHRVLLDQALAIFDIAPDIDLDLMRPNQSLSEFTARAILALDRCYASEKPDLVLVQGDTTTVLCATLAALYHHVPVGHVEAGLRTGDLYAPWPEEANRKLTSHIAVLHFAPTQTSRLHLLGEGIPPGRIHVTGNTAIDALFLAIERLDGAPLQIPGISPETVDRWRDGPVVLITGHRRENFGAKFESICNGIARLSERFPHIPFVYVVHLNPNVRGPVMRILGESGSANVHLVDPLPYLPFVSLMKRSTLILTDSGGVQEEAPSLGKPVLVMRDVTERPEAVDAGTVKLVGSDFRRIVSEAYRLLTDPKAYATMARAHNPYGDGRAAERILKACAEFLGGG